MKVFDENCCGHFTLVIFQTTDKLKKLNAKLEIFSKVTIPSYVRSFVLLFLFNQIALNDFGQFFF